MQLTPTGKITQPWCPGLGKILDYKLYKTTEGRHNDT